MYLEWGKSESEAGPKHNVEKLCGFHEIAIAEADKQRVTEKLKTQKLVSPGD